MEFYGTWRISAWGTGSAFLVAPQIPLHLRSLQASHFHLCRRPTVPPFTKPLFSSKSPRLCDRSRGGRTMGLVCWENVPWTRVLMAEILDQSNEVYFIDITRFKTSWMFLFPDFFYQQDVLLELIGLLSRPCLLGRLSPTNWELISATKEQVQNWKLPTFIARDTKFRTGHQLVLNWWLIGHLLVRRSVPYLQYSAIKEVMLPCIIGMWRNHPCFLFFLGYMSMNFGWVSCWQKVSISYIIIHIYIFTYPQQVLIVFFCMPSQLVQPSATWNVYALDICLSICINLHHLSKSFPFILYKLM